MPASSSEKGVDIAHIEGAVPPTPLDTVQVNPLQDIEDMNTAAAQKVAYDEAREELERALEPLRLGLSIAALARYRDTDGSKRATHSWEHKDAQIKFDLRLSTSKDKRPDSSGPVVARKFGVTSRLRERPSFKSGFPHSLVPLAIYRSHFRARLSGGQITRAVLDTSLLESELDGFVYRNPEMYRLATEINTLMSRRPSMGNQDAFYDPPVHARLRLAWLLDGQTPQFRIRFGDHARFLGVPSPVPRRFTSYFDLQPNDQAATYINVTPFQIIRNMRMGSIIEDNGAYPVESLSPDFVHTLLQEIIGQFVPIES